MVRATSIMNEIAVIFPAMLAATLKNMKCSVCLCFQVDGNQFQHRL
jgi:hypothetical protein